MAQDNSFDIVSKVDIQEVRNAIDQALKEIKARFVWSDISDRSAHWEQAFSTDGGGTWVTNWTMDMTRP